MLPLKEDLHAGDLCLAPFVCLESASVLMVQGRRLRPARARDFRERPGIASPPQRSQISLYSKNAFWRRANQGMPPT